MKWPSVGLGLGPGMLIAESSILVRGMMDSFGSQGVARHYLVALLVYTSVAVVGDLLVQAVIPKGWRWQGAARALPTILFYLIGIPLLDLVPLSVATALGGGLLWVASLHRRWAWPLAAGMLLVALLPTLPQGWEDDAERQALRVSAASPNVLVVVLDTMRKDRTSLYGHQRPTTPTLEALAARGVKFERGYATSCWSIPTHASLLTGRMPSVHGAHSESFRLPGETETIASIFQRLGYDTAGFSGNPYISAGTGFSRGFGHWVECWREHVTRRVLVAGPIWMAITHADVDKGGRDVVASFSDWQGAREDDRPFFAFVNLMEAHSPYQDVPRADLALFVPEGTSERRIEQAGNASHEAQWMGTPVSSEDAALNLDLIDAATFAADRFLRQLLELVDEDTIVLVVSDHGDLLGEHDLWGHMTSLYEPLINVPFVMAGPGLPRARVVTDPVSFVDVLPTLIDAIGIEPPASDGRSLLPMLRGEESFPDRQLRAEHFRTDRATRLWAGNVDPIRLPWIRARRGATITSRLKRVISDDGIDAGYDLALDPGEVRPFPGQRTGLEAKVPVPPVIADPDGALEAMDAAQREALRALGYVQ